MKMLVAMTRRRRNDSVQKAIIEEVGVEWKSANNGSRRKEVVLAKRV